MKTFRSTPEYKSILNRIIEKDACEPHILQVILSRYTFDDRKVVLEKLALNDNLKVTDYDDGEAVFSVHDILGNVISEVAVYLDHLEIESKTREERELSSLLIEDCLSDTVKFVSSRVVDIDDLI